MIRKSLLVLALSAVGSLVMAQELKFNCEQDFHLRCSNTRQQSTFMSHLPGKGRTGAAFRLTCPATFQGQAVKRASFHVHRQLKIESTAKPVLVRVYLKGKGKGSLNLCVYDAKRKPLHNATIYKKFELDSPDKFSPVEIAYTPKAGSLYTSKAVFIMPLISIPAGSDFLTDDWSIGFVEKKKDIVIEE